MNTRPHPLLAHRPACRFAIPRLETNKKRPTIDRSPQECGVGP